MIAHRTFESYEDYTYRQGGKARGCVPKLMKHHERGIESYAKLFRGVAGDLRPGSILCLGARTGAESLGAERAGFRSVGIDLHPVGPTVQKGDWHDLQFPDASFDNVYSNSLDHCLYPDRMAAHVQRVLVPDGRFYVMASNRDDANLDVWRATTKHNEALWWQTSDDLAELLCGFGFEVVKSWRGGKWGHYILKVKR